MRPESAFITPEVFQRKTDFTTPLRPMITHVSRAYAEVTFFSKYVLERLVDIRNSKKFSVAAPSQSLASADADNPAPARLIACTTRE